MTCPCSHISPDWHQSLYCSCSLLGFVKHSNATPAVNTKHLRTPCPLLERVEIMEARLQHGQCAQVHVNMFFCPASWRVHQLIQALAVSKPSLFLTVLHIH